MYTISFSPYTIIIIYTLHILIKIKLWKIFSLLFEPLILHALQEGLVSVKEEV